MRIIAGKYKGRVIKAPRTGAVRPTQDKVRAALFNILGERIVGASVLDLFSGTGALGIEALSRGAKEAVFVEKDRKNAEMIKENISLLGIYAGFKVMATDAEKALCALKGGAAGFDIVVMDPPYHREAAKKILRELARYDILNPNALVKVEHFKKDELDDEVGSLRRVRSSRYGDTLLSFYEVKE